MGRAKVTCAIVRRQGTCSRLPEVFNPAGDKTARIAKGGWSTGWVHSRWWLRPLCLRRGLVLADEKPERVHHRAGAERHRNGANLPALLARQHRRQSTTVGAASSIVQVQRLFLYRILHIALAAGRRYDAASCGRWSIV